MSTIEKTKVNTSYGMYEECPYRNVVKESFKIDSTGHIIKVSVENEVTIPNGNNIEK